ncbi:hypothetical protein JTB14_012414 [Gonioctena quinquepunctata]|nr:hypothetical protein JTB14_012414 [Gonioctena quinquepunctata]
MPHKFMVKVGTVGGTILYIHAVNNGQRYNFRKDISDTNYVLRDPGGTDKLCSNIVEDRNVIIWICRSELSSEKSKIVIIKRKPPKETTSQCKSMKQWTR